MSILLLEDQGLIAIELLDALEEQGHSVTVCTSVCAAHQWLDAHTPRAAIVDCVLSDGDCSELVRRLKQLAVPILVYTGRHQSDLGPSFEDLDVFAKPTPTAHLLAAINAKLALPAA